MKKNHISIFFSLIFVALLLVSLTAKTAQSQSETKTAQFQNASKAKNFSYAGLEKCKGCHPQRYEDFMKRKFKKAWKILEMRGETKNPECLNCHTTGYGKPTGFVNAEATPHLKFKQCESCHGPAGEHVNNPEDKTTSKELLTHINDNDTCIKCHICVKTHRSEDF